MYSFGIPANVSHCTRFKNILIWGAFLSSGRILTHCFESPAIYNLYATRGASRSRFQYRFRIHRIEDRVSPCIEEGKVTTYDPSYFGCDDHPQPGQANSGGSETSLNPAGKTAHPCRR